MDKVQFGRLLIALRNKQGMSQREMAEKLSVSTSAISKWENGRNLPDATMFSRIAEILQVPCEALLNPEKTLKKLANPEPEPEEEEGDEGKEDTEIEEKKEHERKTKSQRRKMMGIAVIAAVLILASGTFLFHQSRKGPVFEQVGARYIDDPTLGRVYELAVVVDGKMNEGDVLVYLEEIESLMKQNPDLYAEIVKVSCYDNEEDASNWEEAEAYGYTFLDVE